MVRAARANLVYKMRDVDDRGHPLKGPLFFLFDSADVDPEMGAMDPKYTLGFDTYHIFTISCLGPIPDGSTRFESMVGFKCSIS